MIFTKDTLFSEVQIPLNDCGSYCTDIHNYLGDWSKMTCQDVIDKFRNDKANDVLMNGRILTALVALGEYFDTYVNDELIKILMERNVRDMKLLMAWRKFKNFPNISIEVKEMIISHLDGKLPKAEKQGDWDYE